jgi:hypothetical protein
MEKDKQICNICNIEKDISEFEWQAGRPNPRKSCKKCRNKKYWEDIKSDPIKHREWLDNRNKHRNENKDLYKSRWMKSVYGITLNEFNDMIINQNGKCKICQSYFFSTKNTHLDHCHSTGVIRGVLCTTCNTGLGMFKDDIGLLSKAILYINNSN